MRLIHAQPVVIVRVFWWLMRGGRYVAYWSIIIGVNWPRQLLSHELCGIRRLRGMSGNGGISDLSLSFLNWNELTSATGETLLVAAMWLSRGTATSLNELDDDRQRCSRACSHVVRAVTCCLSVIWDDGDIDCFPRHDCVRHSPEKRVWTCTSRVTGICDGQVSVPEGRTWACCCCGCVRFDSVHNADVNIVCHVPHHEKRLGERGVGCLYVRHWSLRCEWRFYWQICWTSVHDHPMSLFHAGKRPNHVYAGRDSNRSSRQTRVTCVWLRFSSV